MSFGVFLCKIKALSYAEVLRFLFNVFLCRLPILVILHVYNLDNVTQRTFSTIFLMICGTIKRFHTNTHTKLLYKGHGFIKCINTYSLYKYNVVSIVIYIV